MAADPLIVGVDAGTTRVRALVFTPDGRLLSQGGALTPTQHPRPGWAEHDPQALWHAAVTALREALATISDPSRIVGVAVASVGEAAVPLDGRGNPTFNAIAWFDKRTQAQADWLEQSIGMQRLFSITGLHLEPIFGLCKLLWLKENHVEAYNRTVSWLHVADYIAWRLSGEAATDYSLASRTLALDLKSLTWSEEVLGAAGISPSVLQPLSRSGVRLGTVSADAARETGLPTHCAVGVGGHDHIVGALTVGAWKPGTLLDSLGTAEALMLNHTAPVFNPDLVARGYSQGAMVVSEPQYYVLGGVMTSGASVEWFREVIANGASHDALITEAESIPPGSLGAYFLPHMRVGSPPYPDARARGAFFGLSTDVKRGALYRAMLEGLAYDARSVVDGLTELPDIPDVQRILAIGGDSRNRLLMQIKAAVFNKAIAIVDMAEATSLGAALLGGLAAGLYTSIDQALEAIAISHRLVEPDSNLVATYDSRFREVYTQAPVVLGQLHHRAQTDWDS